jgi:flagellar biosynthesis chaperone FliJ
VSRLSEAIAFRFPLDPYLAQLRREMEAAEAKLAELRAKQQAARRQSDELLQQREAARECVSQAEPMDAVQLRGLHALRTSLAEKAIVAQDAAGKLDGPIQQAKMHALEIRRRAGLLAKLREQRLAEHQRLEDRQIEQTAELHLANPHGRSA